MDSGQFWNSSDQPDSVFQTQSRLTTFGPDQVVVVAVVVVVVVENAASDLPENVAASGVVVVVAVDVVENEAAVVVAVDAVENEDDVAFVVAADLRNLLKHVDEKLYCLHLGLSLCGKPLLRHRQHRKHH